MFVSSYFPLYIMLLILYFGKLLELIDKFSKKKFIFLLTIIVAIIVSLISSFIILKSSGTKTLDMNEIERPDDTIISYMMTYIIPILSVNFNDYGVIAVNFFMFLLIGYLYIRLNLLYLNPLWSIGGYLSYRANSEVIIITNIKYAELKKMTKIRGCYIANDIFIAQKKENQDYI
mgnify:CR=1 FL=1